MQISIIGTGFVGLTLGISLASLGHHVTCVDTDEEKVTALQKGVPPFYEPELGEILHRELGSGRLAFTTRWGSLSLSAVAFLCVGTPSDDQGATDLSQVMAAVGQLARYARHPLTLAVKSTVPVGTSRTIEACLRARPHGSSQVDVVANPEFLREGSALFDSLHPDRIIIGARSERAFEQVKDVYRGLTAPVLFVQPEEAELIKYASNAFLALKISFSNSLADFCERHQLDVRRVTAGVGMDPRIGPHFLGAGLGFGGSCLPKDLRSLHRQFERLGLRADLYQETMRLNDERILRAVEKLRGALGDLSQCRVALLGLSFKPHSDDVRESQSLRLLAALLAEGSEVRAYDPRAAAKARALHAGATYCETAADALRGVDAVIIATDWPEFACLPWQQLLPAMRGHVVLDLRNQLDPASFAGVRIRYMGMGVPERSCG